MAEWLGHLIGGLPFWLVISVGSIVAVIGAILWALPMGFDLPGPKSEWQKSWYKKKENKHGKK